MIIKVTADEFTEAIQLYQNLPGSYQSPEVLPALIKCLAGIYYNYSLHMITQKKLDEAKEYHQKSFEITDSMEKESKVTPLLAGRERLFGKLVSTSNPKAVSLYTPSSTPKTP